MHINVVFIRAVLLYSGNQGNYIAAAVCLDRD